jgi:hypothetical protein
MTATIAPSAAHETTISEAPSLYGDLAYRARCACSWAERSWHHADDFSGPDQPAPAAPAVRIAMTDRPA